MPCSVEEPPGGSHGSGKLRAWGTPMLGEGRPPTETPGHIWSPGEPITGPFKKITAWILNKLFLWEWFLCSWVFVSSILHTINCTYKCLLEGTISHWQLIQKVPEANCTPKWEVSGVINYSLIIKFIIRQSEAQSCAWVNLLAQGRLEPRGPCHPLCRPLPRRCGKEKLGFLAARLSVGNSFSDSQEPAVLRGQRGCWPRKLVALVPLGQAEGRARVWSCPSCPWSHMMGQMMTPLWASPAGQADSADPHVLLCWGRLRDHMKWGQLSIFPEGQPGSGSDPSKVLWRLTSVQFSRLVMSSSLRPCGLQHARPPCPLRTPRAYSNSCPLSPWCHPAISSSVIPFSSCLQSFPASRSFQMSQFFASGGQSIGASASASSPSNEYSGLISFRIDWFDLLAVQGMLKSILQYHSSKASIL